MFHVVSVRWGCGLSRLLVLLQTLKGTGWVQDEVQDFRIADVFLVCVLGFISRHADPFMRKGCQPSKGKAVPVQGSVICGGICQQALVLKTACNAACAAAAIPLRKLEKSFLRKALAPIAETGILAAVY